jgi:hypothetical protein
MDNVRTVSMMRFCAAALRPGRACLPPGMMTRQLLLEEV